MSKPRMGFTLLELLVVISIMAVLVGLFISLVGPLRRNAKLADTKVRMQSIQNGMAVLGQNEGSASYVIQKQTEFRTTGTPPDPEPGIGGILTFGKPELVGTISLPTIGKKPPPKSAEDNGTWGKRGHAHLAFPWGKKFPTISASGGKDNIMVGPEKFRLRDMSPFNTRKILILAGVLPTRDTDLGYGYEQYMTNRKESEPWNDRWGHPIVVASVLYQPTYIDSGKLPEGLTAGAWPSEHSGSTNPISPSSYMPASEIDARQALLDHLKLYQYNRSVYVATAAVGSHARVTWRQLRPEVAGARPLNPSAQCPQTAPSR
jgi:prepilin-type N-terminal cleavage/methylation domain-containing protein